MPSICGAGEKGQEGYKVTYALGTMALLAIAGTVIGTLAFFQPAATKAAWTSKALWLQMGLLSGSVICAAIAIGVRTSAAASPEQNRARTFRIGIITLAILVLPLLFGSMGATGMIPANRMLWAATVLCAAGFILPSIYFLVAQGSTDCSRS